MKRMPAARQWRDAVLLLLLIAALGITGCSGGDGGDHAQQSQAASENSAAARDETGDREAAGGDRGGTNTGEPAEGPVDDRAPEPGAGTGETPPDEGSDPEPQAGMLTAGEWQDTNRWGNWLAQLNGEAGGRSQQLWSFHRFDRLVVEVTADGSPVADAAVTVKDDSGGIVWEARTDIHGRAYAYAELFSPDRNERNYDVAVASGAGVRRFGNVPIPREKPLELELGRAKPLPDSVDILFAVDTTGSMQDELDYLEAELSDVIERVRGGLQEKLKIRIGTDFYRDLHDEYVVRTFPFTEDVALAVDHLAAQTAKGGHDYPEAVDEALDKALDEERWSEDARARLLFLVLDAPPRDDKATVRRMHELVRRAAAMGVRIVPVASSGVNDDAEYLLRFLAVSTGGTYVFLSDHSGVGKDHKEADVGEYEVRALNDLLVDIIRRYSTAPQADMTGAADSGSE